MRVVRRLLAVVLLLGLLTGIAVAVTNIVLVARLERIDGAFDGLADRLPEAAGHTFLMVGTRPGAQGGSDVPWLDGEQSVEAVMLVELAADGRSAQVDTLPAGSGAAEASATALPADLVRAVETWSGRRVDHLIAIDWGTFVRLATDNGVDPAYQFGSGPAVQHDFLRRVMEATLHAELRKQPRNLWRALSTTADGTAIDDDWSTIELDRLLLSLRNLRSHEITYSMAVPG